MRLKMLALLPCALCANLALGQLPGGQPGTEAEYSYIFNGMQGSLGLPAIVGTGQGPTSPDSWNVIDAVESFTNPYGGNAKVTVFPIPWISVSASSTGMNGATADMALSYSVEVNGAGATTPITVFWNASYVVSGSGNSYAYAGVQVGSNYLQCIAGNASGPGEGCGSGSGLFTGSLSEKPGRTFNVTLGAVANSVKGATTYAYVDPYFYLSPAEIAAGDTLVFSASVGNAPSAPTGVPEPSTAALLLSGLALALTVPRVRRKLGSAASGCGAR